MTRTRWVAGWLLAMAVCTMHTPEGARAQTTSAGVEGQVIALEAGELVLDLGAGTGLRVGDRVEIWRPVVLRHPATKRLLSDRFLIGELELVQVRPAMALARAVAPLGRAPEVGDVVLRPGAALPVTPPVEPSGPPAGPTPGAPTAPASAAPSPSPQGAPRDVHAERIAMLMKLLAGANPERRAAAYERLAEKHPDSPYVEGLREEAAALRSARGAAPGSGVQAPVPLAVNAPKVGVLREGEDVDFAAEITGAVGAALHVRTAGEPSFTSLPMRPAGGAHFAATIVGAEVEPPGLEWFLEAVDGTGRVIDVLGSADMPVTETVRPCSEIEPPSETVATLSVSTDYADYNRLRGNDYAWQTEGEFGLRFGHEGVRAVRSGFGVYRGKGGGVDELDEQGEEPRDVGLTYGYLEGEFAPSHSFSITPRLVVGLGDDGVEGGGQLLFRIGNDLETNMLLGGEVLGGVGVRGIAQFELATFERFPIRFRTEVTNQPAGASPSRDDFSPPDQPSVADEGSEIGARGIAEVGFRVVDSLVLRLRGSFQGRNIRHAGPGVGGGVSYSW